MTDESRLGAEKPGEWVRQPKILIGTSGWSYGGWDGLFYPEDVRSTVDRLSFYARHFRTVEVNYSFYHLPKPETYVRWASAVPEDFLFAVKASRFITHVKRLEGVGEAWERFAENAKALDKRLGPVLFQFPASFRIDLGRLSRFLDLVCRAGGVPAIHPVFEFRHSSWFCEKVYSVLREADAALCIAHSSRYPCEEVVTASIAYYRFHGPDELFASSYADKDLASWAKRMRADLEEGRTVYAYFNNDVNGYAVENARTLRQLVEKA